MSINIFSSSSDVSSLFSSLSTSSDSTSGTTNYLADYASIKNGSYGKVLKAYYAKQSSESSSTDSTSETEQKQLATVKSASSELKDISDKLTTNKDLFDDSSSTFSYDTIYKNIKEFADAYNDVVDAGGDSETSSVLRQTLNMVNNTSKNSSMLSKVGITIDSDNKLSVDEDTLKSADLSDLKSLFQGTGSFAYSVWSKASSIEYYAENAAKNQTSYTSSGELTSSSTSGSILDDYL